VYRYLFFTSVVELAGYFHPRAPIVLVFSNLFFATVTNLARSVELKFFSFFNVEWTFDVVLAAIIVRSLANLDSNVVVSGGEHPNASLGGMGF